MNVQLWLSDAQVKLEAAGISTARLDALVLLEDALGMNRANLLAHPDIEITTATQNVLTEQLTRRAGHEPLAFIRGKTEFYGREFVVNQAVLEPRPESEAMISLLLGYTDLGPALRIADVGTGSGALGITAKLELPESSVDLLEIDDDAIKVAKTNVIKLTTGISVFRTDLLEGSANNYDVLLCNLPYVPDEYEINTAASHEPAIALFGGPDGLDLYRKLLEQLEYTQKRPLLILCESLASQHAALKELFATHGYREDTEEDFIQAFVPVNQA
jgi:release factor glutamine methyltransferase